MEARKFGEPKVKKSDNPKFKEEEEQLRKQFTEQVKAEESRFWQWELRLIAERDRLNKDLELAHSAIKQLEAELDNLQAAMAAVPTGGEQVSVYLRGKALKPLNIEIMKRLGTRINLVPVVTKADTLTQNDLFTFKQHVCEVIAAQGIRIYTPPIEADNENADNTCILSDAIPFSIIGPTEGVKAEIHPRLLQTQFTTRQSYADIRAFSCIHLGASWTRVHCSVCK